MNSSVNKWERLIDKFFEAVGTFIKVVTPIALVAYFIGFIFLSYSQEKKETLGNHSDYAEALRNTSLQFKSWKFVVLELDWSSTQQEVYSSGDTDIYMLRDQLESVPFPDRTEFVNSIGHSWCTHLDSLFWFPDVEIYDIRTGEEMESHSCVWNRALDIAAVAVSDTHSFYQLREAIAGGNLTDVWRALGAGENPNGGDSYSVTPLMDAAFYGDPRIIQALINAGGQVNQFGDIDGWTPLTYAIMGRQEDAIEFLLNAGANPDGVDKFGRTPFWWAHRTGKESIKEKLISSGAAQIFRIFSPVKSRSQLVAAKEGDLDTLVIQLRDGESIDSTDSHKRTALMLAVIGGSEDIVQYLLKEGAEINAIDDLGRSALYHASKYDEPELVDMLVSNGAGVNNKSHFGWTPLMRAAYFGNDGVAKRLLEANADTIAKDLEGQTAGSIAEQQGHPNIKKLINDKLIQDAEAFLDKLDK